uniref:Uncharacterized protein n=1 Tax=Rhodopseudomonas palustris (strain BisA53) TaxID=316055 RepID=Q07NA4_RHOP5
MTARSHGALVPRLWSVAPAWRVAVIVAVAASALALLFPPRLLTNGRQVPGQGAYVSPAAVAPPAASNAAALSSSIVPPTASLVPRESGAKFGDIVETSVRFGGRAIPLPAGQWRVVASLPTMAPGGIAIDMKVLSRERSGVLVGLIALVGNDKATPSPTGYRSDGNCERSDYIFTNVVKNEDFAEQECSYIDFIAPNDVSAIVGEPGLRAAFGDLRQRGVELPSTLVAAALRLGDRHDLLIARIYLNPETTGLPRPQKIDRLDNDWNKYNLPRYGDKLAYFEKVKAWLARWTDVLRATWKEQAYAVDEHDRLLPE